MDETTMAISRKAAKVKIKGKTKANMAEIVDGIKNAAINGLNSHTNLISTANITICVVTAQMTAK